MASKRFTINLRNNFLNSQSNSQSSEDQPRMFDPSSNQQVTHQQPSFVAGSSIPPMELAAHQLDPSSMQDFKSFKSHLQTQKDEELHPSLNASSVHPISLSKSKYNLGRMSLLQQQLQQKGASTGAANRLSSIVPNQYLDTLHKQLEQQTLNQNDRAFKSRLSVAVPSNYLEQLLHAQQQQTSKGRGEERKSTEKRLTFNLNESMQDAESDQQNTSSQDLDVTFASNERRASASGRGDSSPFIRSFQTDKYLLSNDQLYNVAQGQGILNEGEDYNQLKSYLEQLSSLTHLSQDNIDQIANFINAHTQTNILKDNSEILQGIQQGLLQQAKEDQELLQRIQHMSKGQNQTNEQEQQRLDQIDQISSCLDRQTAELSKWPLIGQEVALQSQDLMMGMLDVDEQVKIYESQLQEMTDSFNHLQLENDFILQEQQTELQLMNQLSATRLKLVDEKSKQLEIDIYSESDKAANQLETLTFIVQEDQNGLIQKAKISLGRHCRVESQLISAVDSLMPQIKNVSYESFIQTVRALAKDFNMRLQKA